MAFLDEIFPELLTQGKPPKVELDLQRSVEPQFNPVTSDEVIAALKLPSGSADSDLDGLIGAVTHRLETETNRGFIQQTWIQTQNSVGQSYTLFRRPVLSIESIEYIANYDADDLLTVDSSLYVTSGQKDRIRSRSLWPTHRGWQSWITTFKVGYAAHVDAPTEEQKTTAREAVPEDIRRAIIQWIGHLYENREGMGPELKYEVIAKRTGPIPGNVSALIQNYIDRRFFTR